MWEDLNYKSFQEIHFSQKPSKRIAGKFIRQQIKNTEKRENTRTTQTRRGISLRLKARLHVGKKKK
jgi:hypothetical protein